MMGKNKAEGVTWKQSYQQFTIQITEPEKKPNAYCRTEGAWLHHICIDIVQWPNPH